MINRFEAEVAVAVLKSLSKNNNDLRHEASFFITEMNRFIIRNNAAKKNPTRETVSLPVSTSSQLENNFQSFGFGTRNKKSTL
ncbi:MAG: hypothetical protein LBJ09_01275 [Clostridiales bacterium]|jgi:hypothetical protein|nr:hypothetical protein [Clostridiales bacterium]